LVKSLFRTGVLKGRFLTAEMLLKRNLPAYVIKIQNRKYFIVSKNVQAGSWADSTSYSMGAGVLFPGDKAAGA
jgi:hypothetical protein